MNAQKELQELFKKIKELADMYDPNYKQPDLEWMGSNTDDAFWSGVDHGRNSVYKQIKDAFDNFRNSTEDN